MYTKTRKPVSMNNLEFIIKSFALSLFLSFVLGAISGVIIDVIHPPHPHQMVATWMMMGIVSAFAGIIISLLVSTYMVIKDKLDMNKLLIISNCGALVILFVLWFLI